MQNVKCKNCGMPLDIDNAVDGVVDCGNCHYKQTLTNNMDTTTANVSANDKRGASISISEQSKLDIAKSMLDNGNFAAVITRCDAIIEANVSCALAHWYAFLACNKCKSSAEFEKSKGQIVRLDRLKSAIASADDKLKKECYTLLFNRAMATPQLSIYAEYVSLPDCNAQNVKKLNEVMFSALMEGKISDDSCEVFESILKTVKNNDTFVEMNLSFADKIFASDSASALKYYNNVISVDKHNNHALWEIFRLSNSLKTTADVAAYLSFKENCEKIQKEVFAHGFNLYAVEKMFEACLQNTSLMPMFNTSRLDSVFSLIPQSMEDLYVKCLNDVTNSLLIGEQYASAGRYNDIIIAKDKYNDMAYFKRLYIKNRTLNPLMFIKTRNTLYDDPDFSLAIDAYAETHAGEPNIYIDLVQSLQNFASLSERENIKPVIKKLRLNEKGLNEPISKTVSGLIFRITAESLIANDKIEPIYKEVNATGYYKPFNDGSYDNKLYAILKLFVTEQQINESKKAYDAKYGEGAYERTRESMTMNGGLDALGDTGVFNDKWFDDYANSAFGSLNTIAAARAKGKAFNDEDLVNIAHVLMVTQQNSKKLSSRVLKRILNEYGERPEVLEILDDVELDDEVPSKQKAVGGLSRIVIPDSVTEIEDEMFYGCYNLAEVKIGSGVKRIGHYAFADCKALKKIDAPDSEIDIDGYAFKGCDKITDVKGKSIQEALKKRDEEIAEKKRITEEKKAEKKRAADEKAAEEKRKEDEKKAERKREAEAKKAAERRKALAKRLVAASILGVLGVGFVVLGIFVGAELFVYDSAPFDKCFMQEMPIILAALICLYACVAVLCKVRLGNSIASAVSFAATVFILLFLAFIVFIWINPELFDFFKKSNSWSKGEVVTMPPVWATALVFIGGVIVLEQCILGIIAGRKHGYFTLEWFLDEEGGIAITWVACIIPSIVASMFFFAGGFAFSALDSSYSLGYSIFSYVTFTLGLFSFGLLAGDNDRVHDSYFAVHALFNCVKAGLFILCALSVLWSNLTI